MAIYKHFYFLVTLLILITFLKSVCILSYIVVVILYMTYKGFFMTYSQLIVKDIDKI